MLSLLRRMLYRQALPLTLSVDVGIEIAGCERCVRYLHNRFALSFITHIVEDHKMCHDTATEILERVHRQRLANKQY